jgi:hypothetical protein
MRDRYRYASDAIAERADLLAAGATVVLAFAAALWLFASCWQRSALEDISTQPGGWIGALAVVALGAVIHELLHAFTWCVLGRVSWRSVSCRRSARAMGFVAQLDEAVPAAAYRAGVALPAIALGLGPIVVGLLTGHGLIVLWGLFFVLESFSDLALLLAARRVPAGALVRAHPDRLGCQFVVEA